MSGWWTVAAIWLVACILILMANHGAHKDDGDDDER